MISVIIVAYNEEALINSIIKELRQQQFRGDYEILLADGGSSDKTVELAGKEHVSGRRAGTRRGSRTLNCRP